MIPTTTDLALHLQRNSLVALAQGADPPRLYRVLERSANASTLWLMPLDTKSASIVCCVATRAMLEECAANGQLVLDVPLPDTALPPKNRSQAEERGLEHNRRIVDAVRSHYRALFTLDGVDRSIFATVSRALRAEQAPSDATISRSAACLAPPPRKRSRAGVSARTVERVTTRWLHAGQSDAGLLPRYERSGGRGKPRFLKGKKTGPQGFAVRSGEVAPDEDYRATTQHDRTQIREHVDLMIIKHRQSIDDTVQAWHNVYNFVTTSLPDAPRQRVELPRRAQLSESTVRHWISQYLGEKGMFRKRVGERAYHLVHREKAERRDQFDVSPGLRCQIDSMSISNVEAVSSIDEVTPLGQMTLYGTVDVYTTNMAGAFLTFDKPSVMCAAQCLLNTALRKDSLLKAFGLSEFRWVSFGEYAEGVADWGPEFRGHDPTEWVGRTGMTWTNVPAYRPEVKPKIESCWSVIQRHPKRFQRARQRNEHRPELPQLTPLEIARAVLLAIIEREAYVLPTEFLDATALEDGQKALSRREYYLWARKTWGWHTPERSPGEILLSLLPRQAGHVGDRGINVRGFYFTLPPNLSDEWMLRRTSRQRPAICVVWNPDLVMDTWAYNLVTGAKIQLSLLHVYRRFGRLSWSELRAFQKTVAVAHGWATEEWRDERSALDATSAEFGLLPVGGKRLSAARASLITELPRPILNAVKEDALEYEGERGGLQELCNDSAIRAWNYAEQE